MRITEVSDGIECSVSGKVIRTFEAYGDFMATLIDDSGRIQLAFNSPFSLGSLVSVSGKASRRGGRIEIRAEKVEFVSEGREELGKRIEGFVSESTKPKEAEPLISDGVMRALQGPISECAGAILRAKFLMRTIILRYHGDSDGICSGLALSGAIGQHDGRFITIQNHHAVYELSDALRDINSVRTFSESAGPPLLILADIGSGQESSDAFGMLKGAGFEIMLIDHHPLSQGVSDSADFILSPMTAAGNSYYSAGLLSGEVAKAVGGPDPTALQRISLAGDKSGLVSHEPDSVRKALALDYLGRYSKFQNTLEFYGSVLSDDKMLESIYSQASAKTERAVRVAKESLKVKELPNGFRLCTADLARAFRPGSFPGKGTLCGALHDIVRKEMTGPLVTIGYSGRMISIRANQEARERGFDANAMINEIRRELVNAIESGGGHDVAASVHVFDGFENIILEEIVRHVSSV